MVLQPKKEGFTCQGYENIQGLSKEELEQEYSQNLANGKKNLLCGDYPEAVTCFQNACYLQSERFGDTNPECAEAFFFYGKALLELARVENTVLGNALKGVPETEDSESETENEQFEKAKNVPVEEREQMRQDVEAAMATEEEDSLDEQDAVKDDCKSSEEAAEASGASMETSEADKSQPCEEKEEESTEEKQELNTETEQSSEEKKEETATKETTADESIVDEPSSNVDADEKPSSSSGEAENATKSDTDVQEDPDDIPNMQLAWEMLELANVLYSKKPESESNSLLIAQCHSKLGELGLEVEDYEQSLGDFNQCLEIYQKYLTDSDRKLAEIHYNLGLAYYFKKDYGHSLKHYKSALDVLERRIEHLDELIDAKGDKDDKEVLDECTEVGEIKNLIPDINSKIEDVLLMKQRENRLSAFGESSSSGFPAQSSSSSKVAPVDHGACSSSSENKTTNDISHLVRRKRTSADNEQSTKTAPESEPSSKKPKQEKVNDMKGVTEGKAVDENDKENVNVAETAQ